MKLVFADNDGVNPRDWEPVPNEEDGIGVDESPELEEQHQDQIKLRVKPVRKDKKKVRKADWQEKEIHRGFNQRTNYGGDPDRVQVGMDKHKSDSTKEFYYAPGDGGLTTASLGVRPLLFGESLYQDNQMNYSPTDPHPWPDRIEDSGTLTTPKRRRPGIKKDSESQLDRMKHPSGLPEPPDAMDLAIGNLVYPLSGAPKSKRRKVQQTPKSERKRKKRNSGQQQAQPEARTRPRRPTQQHEGGGSLVAEGPWESGRWTFSDLTYGSAGASGEHSFGVTATLDDPDLAFSLVFYVGPVRAGSKLALQEGSYLVTPVSKVEEPGYVDKGGRADDSISAEIFRSLPDEVIQLAIQNVRPAADKEGKRKKGDVLSDPALPADMTKVERLFTPIRDWRDNAFMADFSKLDDVAKQLIEENPTGEGKYFSWRYRSAEDLSDSEFVGDPFIVITRTPAWIQEEPNVKQRQNAETEE